MHQIQRDLLGEQEIILPLQHIMDLLEQRQRIPSVVALLKEELIHRRPQHLVHSDDDPSQHLLRGQLNQGNQDFDDLGPLLKEDPLVLLILEVKDRVELDHALHHDLQNREAGRLLTLITGTLFLLAALLNDLL